MRCEICGSRKDVRKFFGYVYGRSYTECRKCFLLVMSKCGAKDKGEIEEEWNRGKTE